MERILNKVVSVLLVTMAAVSARAQSTAFTYQGSLTSGGLPANGSFDLAFSLYANTNGGGPVAGPVTNAGTAVSNGLFTVSLDFGGGVFTGGNYWLQVAVQSNGGSGFTTLSPLQPITPTPYALYAPTAGSAASVSGPISLVQLPATVVTNGESGLSISGIFNGNGNGLTNLNATQISSGTVSPSLLPSNVVMTAPFLQTNVYSSAGTMTVIVPSGATLLTAKLWGAGGGGGYNAGGGAGYNAGGGGGAFVQQTINVVPGETFVVVVGQRGDYYDNNAGGNGSGDAAGGNTIYGSGGGQGGQASSLFYFNGANYITEAVAGAGGGGGYAFAGGGAGGNPGQTGGGNNGGAGGDNGLGGAAVPNGQAGGNYATGATNTGISSLSSANGDGGSAVAETYVQAGGGGGGFGGAASGGNSAPDYGGGGGGGSYGAMVIAGTNYAAGNTGDPSYVSPNGTGGAGFNPGADGLAVIIFSGSAGNVTVGGTVTAASFSGSGASLSNLNASSLTGGTLSSAVLPVNLQTLTGNNAVNLTNIQAVALPPNLQVLNNNNGVNLTNIQAAALPPNVLMTVQTPLLTNVYSSAGTTTVIVPVGVNRLTAKLWGAGGGYGSGTTSGGGGAFAQQTLSVVAGQTFTVVVGQHGDANDNNAGGNGSGDAAGGNVYAPYGGGQGGQASSLFHYNGTNFITEAVAGAGGGAGATGGGGAGGNPGQTGGSEYNYGGGGGDNGSGGAGGGNAGGTYYIGATTTGVASLGSANGNGGASSIPGAGGGGGGFGGGGSGGGYFSAGGGGGSYGAIVIAGNSSAPGNTGDPSYVSPNGTGGGEASPAADGLVVITFSVVEATGSGFITAAGFTGNGSGLSNLNATQITSGTVPLAYLPATIVTNAETGVTLGGAFSGDGSQLTNLTASHLSVGTAAISITGNAATATTATNVPSGISVTNAFLTNAVITNSTLSGNGGGLTNLSASKLIGALPAINGTSLTNLNASQLTTGSVPVAQLPSVVVTNNAANVTLNSVTLNGTTGASSISANSYVGGTIQVSEVIANSEVYCSGPVYGQAFDYTSDRTLKENFTAINPQEVLDKVAKLPVTAWNYKTAQNKRHLGPMAQDFQAAFGLNGPDDKHISVVDETGVALAAIQGLNQKLERQNAALTVRLERLEKLLKAATGDRQ